MHRKSTLLIVLAVLALGAVCVGPPPPDFTTELAPSIQRVEELVRAIRLALGR